MKTRISAIFLVLVITCSTLVLLYACSKSSSNPGINSNNSSITTILKSSVNATIFYQAMTRTGVDTILSGAGPYTVFVPTDTAFMNAGITNASVTAAPVGIVKNLILYHTLSGKSLITTNFPMGSNSKVIAANGDSIFISNIANGFFVNGIPVEQSDIGASNGVIQAITESPLLPAQGTLTQLIFGDTLFTFLGAAITRASQGSTDLVTLLTNVGPYTLLAPTNEGFKTYGFATVNDINNANPDSLAKLISYHIIPSRLFSCDITNGQQTLTLQGTTVLFTSTGSQRQIKGTNSDANANLIKANIMARNGVLYIIDNVLVP
jgi:uncharacterized surface protein with fasciclin (FAS1) repeats